MDAKLAVLLAAVLLWVAEELEVRQGKPMAAVVVNLLLVLLASLFLSSNYVP